MFLLAPAHSRWATLNPARLANHSFPNPYLSSTPFWEKNTRAFCWGRVLAPILLLFVFVFWIGDKLKERYQLRTHSLSLPTKPAVPLGHVG